MPLQGNLKEMSLANLIQVNCQEMRSARLTLTQHGQVGEIFLSDGQVVHATLGAQSGEPAIYEMLFWDAGEFVLDLDIAAAERSIGIGWQDLLLKGMMEVPQRQGIGEQAEEKMNPAILEQLGAIEGVRGAVISASDGVVLGAAAPDSTGESEAAVAVFVGSAANQLGDALQLAAFQHGTVTLKNKRILVLEQPDRFIGLVLNENASAAIVASAAEKLFKK